MLRANTMQLAATLLFFTPSLFGGIVEPGDEYQIAGLDAHSYELGPTSLIGGHPTGPGKWGDPEMGTSAAVSYSFIPTGTVLDSSLTNLHLQTFMPTNFESEIRRAFDAWSAHASISFFEVADDGVAFNANPTTGHGNIRIGAAPLDGARGTLAIGFFPPPNANTAAGDIFFDSSENWAVNSLDGDSSTIDVFQVTAHEIGHAIGLSHSNTPDSLMNATYTESFSGLQADDIAGVKFIYGNPEPSSAALLSLGIFGVYWRRRSEKLTKKK